MHVSSVVESNAMDAVAASRITNMLTAMMNNKDPEYGKATLNVQLLEKERKLRIMLWGTIQFTEVMLSTIKMLTSED